MTEKVELSILTDPIPYGRYYFSELSKKVGRRVRNHFRPVPEYLRSSYRGHFAVTRSLVEGLKKIGAKFNYNPHSVTSLAESVVVLSGIATLRQAIDLKRAGYIKKLVAGPNLVVFPSDARDLMCAPEVDLCITPNRLISDLYIDDCPELEGRCTSWPAGVDTEFWKPDSGVKDDKFILIYEKQHGSTVIGPVSSYASVVEDRGYRVEIVKYGQYLPHDYLALLQRASLMVAFSPSESQGIAWAEAWAVDVPLLVWYQDYYTYGDKTFKTSPAPYLSKETGMFFSSLPEFESALSTWESNERVFRPRRWVVRSMSDQVCAHKLCALAAIGQKNGASN